MYKYKTPSESSGFLLWKVTNLWQREIRKALRKYDLTHTQFVILASTIWLSKEKENITQVDIANHIEIDKMMTSNVIRTLEKNGLLTRSIHKTDTRAKVITPTNKGTLLVKKALRDVEEFDSVFFGEIADVNTFNKGLLNLLEK